MKIAIDVGPLKSGDNVRGIGVYTRELIYTLESIQKSGVNKFDLYSVDYFSHQTSIINHYDVIHFTRFNPFFISVPFKKPAKTEFVLTIYDLIPLIYPKHYPAGVKGRINWQINKFLIKKNIDAIITISETSKKDICRFIGIDPKKVFVTYLAPRSIFKNLEIGSWRLKIAKRYSLPEHFALYVGDINYNKNIPFLVKVCKIAKAPLVICGKQATETENMNLDHPELKHLKNIDWDNVTRLGFVPDEDLVKIYNLASVYIQPSLYEGFGLPVLEAQAVGIPVVASKTQALVEISEDSALFANPKDPVDFSKKIRLILADANIKRDIVAKGFQNVKKYTWDKTGSNTIKVYQ